MIYRMTPELSTGNEYIDKDHQELFDTMNRFINHCSQGNCNAEVKETIAFLYRYTKTHFQREEQLQEKYNYPAYARHKAFHVYFMNRVKELNEHVQKNGITVEMAAKVNIRVGGELLAHILYEDKELAKFVQKKQAEERYRSL